MNIQWADYKEKSGNGRKRLGFVVVADDVGCVQTGVSGSGRKRPGFVVVSAAEHLFGFVQWRM